MNNPVYNMIVKALSGSVSARAAETMLQATLREHGLGPETVTASDMQELLSGPLMSRLSGVLPPNQAKSEAQALSKKLENEYPKAPTLFTDVGAFATWDDTTVAPVNPVHDATGLSADDFEFDDPEFGGGGIQEKVYVLENASAQEDLIRDLGRMQGVLGVMVSRANGEMLKMRAMRDATSLSGVIAAASKLFQKQNLKLMSADLGSQTICMRPMGDYCVAVVAGPQVNIGRLLTELQQVGAAT